MCSHLNKKINLKIKSIPLELRYEIKLSTIITSVQHYMWGLSQRNEKNKWQALRGGVKCSQKYIKRSFKMRPTITCIISINFFINDHLWKVVFFKWKNSLHVTENLLYYVVLSSHFKILKVRSCTHWGCTDMWKLGHYEGLGST